MHLKSSHDQRLLPAQSGEWYFKFERGERAGSRISFYLPSVPQPLAVIHGVDVLTADEHVTRHRIALRQANLLLDQRIFVFPSANLLVTIPEIGNKLNVHGVDFTELMEESGADYLAVLSQPPATVSQGDSFSYQMDVRSKKAGVKYELSSGPDGMKVSKEGLVT